MREPLDTLNLGINCKESRQSMAVERVVNTYGIYFHAIINIVYYIYLCKPA